MFRETKPIVLSRSDLDPPLADIAEGSIILKQSKTVQKYLSLIHNASLIISLLKTGSSSRNESICFNPSILSLAEIDKTTATDLLFPRPNGTIALLPGQASAVR
jgi:hypothetical protein